MKSQAATDPTLAAILQKLGRSSSTHENPNEAGEATWSISQVVGMLQRKAIIIGISSLAVSGLMGVRTAKNIPEFEGSFRLLVEPVTQKSQVADQLTDTRAMPTSDKGLDYSTQIEVLYSPKLLNPILKEVNKQYPGSTVETIAPNLNVVRLGETKIIEVTYHDSNSDKVQLVLKNLERGYLEYSREEQQAQLKQGIKFVSQELPKIQEKVNSLQKQLEQLRQRFNFVDPQSSSDDLSKQLLTLAQQRQALQSDIAAMQTQQAILKQQLGQAVALQQSAQYQSTLQKYQALEQQLAIESARLGVNHPNIQLLKRQQENLSPILFKQAAQSIGDQLAKVENDLQITLARYRSLTQVYDQINQQYRQMPSVSREYSELQQELKIATESLTRFLQTQDNLQIQAAKDDIPWQLIADSKQLKLKSSNNPIKSMTMGAVTGALLGIALAFALEKLENTHHTVDELKRKVKLPIVGIIPLHPALKDELPGLHIVDLRPVDHPHSLKELDNSSGINWEAIQVYSHASSQISTPPEQNYWLREYDAYGFMEAFRTLYANLQRLEVLDHGSLVISSPLPDEGRTTISIHVAQAAAAMGQRVLLVDAHLRRGSTQVHSLLGLPSRIGLSDYLKGNSSLTESIQRLSWESSLFVMAAGDPPADPTRLFSSEKMNLLMSQLQQSFDLVIYDMPPLMGLADVKLIAAQANGLLLATRLGQRGSASALAYTIERLQLAQIPIVGLIANGQKNYTVDLYA